MGVSALGGMMATRSLPAVTPPRVDVRDRGWFQRLQLTYRTVEIGLKNPFSVLHISDTHLTAAYPDETQWLEFAEDRKRVFGGLQEHSLAEALAWAKMSVDCVIHTGDLIDFQSKANLDLVKRYFGSVGELLCTAGNHEFHCLPKEAGVKPTEAYNETCRAALDGAFERDLRFAARTVNGVTFVALENVYGFFTEDQVRRFREVAAKGLPMVLCLHVPIYTDGIRRTWGRFLAMGSRFADAAVPAPEGDIRRQRDDPLTREFVAYLRKEPLLKAVLAGHLHLFAEDRFSPTAMEYVVGANYFPNGQEVMFV